MVLYKCIYYCYYFLNNIIRKTKKILYVSVICAKFPTKEEKLMSFDIIIIMHCIVLNS